MVGSKCSLLGHKFRGSTEDSKRTVTFLYVSDPEIS